MENHHVWKNRRSCFSIVMLVLGGVYNIYIYNSNGKMPHSQKHSKPLTYVKPFFVGWTNILLRNPRKNYAPKSIDQRDRTRKPWCIFVKCRAFISDIHETFRIFPIGSMYGIYIHIHLHENHKNQPNAGKYTIPYMHPMDFGHVFLQRQLVDFDVQDISIMDLPHPPRMPAIVANEGWRVGIPEPKNEGNNPGSLSYSYSGGGGGRSKIEK